MSTLPVEQAYRLADRPEEQRWLVTGLWSEQAVGIVGGNQKEVVMRRTAEIQAKISEFGENSFA